MTWSYFEKKLELISEINEKFIFILHRTQLKYTNWTRSNLKQNKNSFFFKSSFDPFITEETINRVEIFVTVTFL